jgi:hypothetical protein
MHTYEHHLRRPAGHDDTLLQEVAIAPALEYGLDAGLERLGR